MIGYLGLSDWWFSSLTEDQRRTIRRTYTPMGGCDLETGKIEFSDVTPLSFLASMAGWFSKADVRPIAYRILDKAATYLPSANDALDVHFFYQAQIEIYYRDRNTQEGLDRAVGACRDQIAYASTAASAFKRQHRQEPLPSHKGYTQLAIILESQKKFREAIDLCSEARSNGWCGDWDSRIERCNRKLKAA